MVFNLSLNEKQKKIEKQENSANFPEKDNAENGMLGKNIVEEDNTAEKDEKNVESGNRAKNVGIDMGYGFVKLIDGSDEIKFPSVVGMGRELRFKSQFGNNKSEIDNIVVHSGSKTYFVGNLAVRQSDIASRSLDADRIKETNYKILMLAALKMMSRWEGQGYYNVVTGLPINIYDKKEELLEEIKQPYEVSFGSGSKAQRYKMTIKQAEIVPQPFGTLFDLVLNSSGKIVDKELSESTVGIVDIGFKTTDFAAADSMEFIDYLSTSTATALTNGYYFIADYLRKEFDIRKESHELDRIITEGKVRVAGKIHDISHIKKEVYEGIASKIATDINSAWDYKNFDRILLTGGGGAELSEFLIPEFPNMELVEQPQFSNVRGYQKLANSIFNK